jgi:hypothetical protein
MRLVSAGTVIRVIGLDEYRTDLLRQFSGCPELRDFAADICIVQRGRLADSR